MYDVASFTTEQTTQSATCPYPPCVNQLQRPNPQLGAINSFQSESSSIYNGMTVSLKRTMSHGMYFQVGYTLAKAIDDGQDALVVGRSGNVQDSYATSLERGPSVNDQRNRFVVAWVAEPNFISTRNFSAGWPTIGSCPAFSPRDPDAPSTRLWPGIPMVTATSTMIACRIWQERIHRSGLLQHRYASTRSVRCGDRVVLNFIAESFNLFNRTNSRVQISDDGFYNSAGQFVAYSTTVTGTRYPGEFLMNSQFLTATNAYAPRQVQLSLRLSF